MSRIRRQTLTYAENFQPDYNTDDLSLCQSVAFDNGVLRGLPTPVQCAKTVRCQRLAGVSPNYLYYAYSHGVMRFNAQQKSDCIYMASSDLPVHDFIYSDCARNRILFGFADTKVLRADESAATALDWSYGPVRYAAAVNDRVVALTQDGRDVIFGEGEFEQILAGENANYFRLPSQCDAIKSISHNVAYALGRNVYKITFSDDAREIKCDCLAKNVGDVAGKTVAVLRDKIIFAANGGLYVLCNDKVKRLMPSFQVRAQGGFFNCTANVADGMYVLTCPQEQGVYNTYVLDVDKERCVCKAGSDVADLINFGGDVYAVALKGRLCKLDKTVCRAGKFVRSNLCFGTPCRKHLREMSICSKGDVTVSITDGACVRNYFVKASDSVQTLPISGFGQTFRCEISSSGGVFEVSQFTLTAQIFKEDNYVG